MMRFFLLLAVCLISLASCHKQHSGNNYPRPSAYKVSPDFTPLPYGAIEPTGWLRHWCENAKNGLVLNNPALEQGWLDKQPRAWLKQQNGYWLKDVKDFNQAWLNGQPPFPLGEQTAYWIDGMVRLGLALHDSALLKRSVTDIQSVIKNNYIGDGGWGASIYERAILAYYQGSKDIDALNYLTKALRQVNLQGFSGIEIWKDGMDSSLLACIHETEPRNIVQTESMFEAYSFTGDSALLKHAFEGLKRYEHHFIDFWNGKYSQECNFPSKNGCVYSMHGVSYNEMAKLWAIAYLHNGNANYLKASVNAYRLLDSLHIMPHGVNSAMENIAGVDAQIPTETCDVADYINSVTWLYRITGQAGYGDRIEKAFFNAAPAAVAPDYKTHVYFQAPNALALQGKWAFQELHDPLCCSGNQARILPNYLLHMLMATNDAGLAFNLYGPCSANVLVGDKVGVALNATTQYPFEENVTVKVDPKQAVQFPFYFRIPAWCKNPSITVNGEPVDVKTNNNGFAKINRVWRANDMVVVSLPRQAAVLKSKTTTNNTFGSTNVSKHLKATSGVPFATVEYGPLLFALKITGTSNYNYALALGDIEVRNVTTGPEWSWGNAPIEIEVPAVPFTWANAPALPQTSAVPTGKPQKIVLVPYGCTQGTRISMFPYVSQ